MNIDCEEKVKCDDEAELILCARRGERSAMEILIKRHTALLWSLAKRIACSAWVEPEELVQAGCLGFLRAIDKYDASRKTKLITYAVPWILGEMKRVLRETTNALGCIPMEDNGEGNRKHALIETLGCAGGMDIETIDLHLMLSRLSAEEQNVIDLRYFRDRTQRETAVQIGKSQTQVSRLEYRALEKLKAMLGQ